MVNKAGISESFMVLACRFSNITPFTPAIISWAELIWYFSKIPASSSLIAAAFDAEPAHVQAAILAEDKARREVERQLHKVPLNEPELARADANLQAAKADTAAARATTTTSSDRKAA